MSELPPALPDSKTHRLSYCAKAPEGQRWQIVQNCAADELEELREFVKFLFPKGGQNLFKLCPPDLLELRWSVYDRNTMSTYCYGASAIEAVNTARDRIHHERHPDLSLKNE